MPHPLHVKHGDQISAERWNALVNLATRTITGPRVMQTTSGWHIRDAPVTPPGDNYQLVIVRNIGDATDRFVNVQRVKPTIEDGEWTGGFHTVGDVIEMTIYPFQSAEDYQAFIWSDELLTEETCILPAIRINGVWYLLQYLRHRLAPPNTIIPITDCAISMLE